MTFDQSQNRGSSRDHHENRKNSLRHLFKKDFKQTFHDFRRGDLKRSLRRDLQEIRDFYLDEERRGRLASMSRIKRWIYMLAWLMKGLFLKLTPTRRVLLLISLVLLISFRFSSGEQGETSFGFNQPVLSVLILLFILMLELKDKLLARDELETGRSVQLALLPDKNPRLPGWDIWLFTRPANDVGGDLVDYLELQKNRLGVALGDVSGKGLGAALLMAKLQATFRALVRHFDSLDELGVQINEILCRDGLPNRFATLLYLELTSGSGSLRVLNAGHIPPVIFKGTGLEKLPPVAMPLGAMSSVAYSEQRLEVQPGEILLVYSDGVTEARNEEGIFFGEERLMDLLPEIDGLTAEAAGQYLLTEIERFVGEARYSDDLSLILMKRIDH